MARIYIETYGCTLNQADSDVIRGVLVSSGHEVADSIEESDLVVINSCGVLETTENKIIKRARELLSAGKLLILAGCLTKIAKDRILRELGDISLVSPQNLRYLPKVVEETLRGKNIKLLNGGDSVDEKYSAPRLRLRNRVSAIVPIAEGCLGNCTYCCVRFARGRLRSRDPRKILEEVREAVREGYREILLTAQDTGAYGRDIGASLPELLSGIAEIEGDFRVRVGMMNPEHAIDLLDDLVESFESEKIYKFLHLPMQHGDNDILRKMGRRYTIEDVYQIVDTFRRKFPDLTLAVDVIVGFPGEGEEEFSNLIEAIERVEPDIINLNRFSPRPGTPAEKLDGRVHGRIVKDRSRIVDRIRKEIGLRRNYRYLGKSFERALVVEEGKVDGTYIARTSNYKQVVISGETGLGEFLDVRIIDVHWAYLWGEIIR